MLYSRCGILFLFYSEFHSEPEEEDVPEEHALLLRSDLRDRFQHSKGSALVFCKVPGVSTRRSLSSSSRSSVQASEEPEERETLALMAARGDSEDTQDGETYIEKYTRGVLEVENILSLERLRQVRQHKLHDTS